MLLYVRSDYSLTTASDIPYSKLIYSKEFVLISYIGGIKWYSFGRGVKYLHHYLVLCISKCGWSLYLLDLLCVLEARSPHVDGKFRKQRNWVKAACGAPLCVPKPITYYLTFVGDKSPSRSCHRDWMMYLLEDFIEDVAIKPSNSPSKEKEDVWNRILILEVLCRYSSPIYLYVYLLLPTFTPKLHPQR